MKRGEQYGEKDGQNVALKQIIAELKKQVAARCRMQDTPE